MPKFFLWVPIKVVVSKMGAYFMAYFLWVMIFHQTAQVKISDACFLTMIMLHLYFITISFVMVCIAKLYDP